MSEAEAEAEGSSFFKIFLDTNCCAKTMRIPPAFKKKMKGKKSGAAVYLSGRGEDETWQVDLIKGESGGGLYFAGEGWTKFVTHHSIGSADFLIFKFDGEETFKVTVFGPTGCEKLAKRLHDVKIEAEAVDLPVAASSSAFPSFISTMKPYNVSTGRFVDIPAAFVRRYLENVKNKTMFVLCCQGKEWPVYILLQGNKGFFTTGWRVFVVENQLKVGDICKFELQEPLRFHVTVSATNA